MSDFELVLMGAIIGYVLHTIFDIAIPLHKRTVAEKKLNDGWLIMNAYRDSAKAQRERGLKNNDKTS